MKKKTIRNLFIGAVLTVVVLCVLAVVFSPSEETPAAPTQVAQQSEATSEEVVGPTTVPTETAIPEPTSTPTPKPPTNTPTPKPPTATPVLGLFGPGTYLVGDDIQPGIYWGMGGEGIIGSCYWARLSNLSGEFDALIANENSVGQFYIEIKDTDEAFETACEIIQLEYAPVPETESFYDQPWNVLVGRDIQPGRYRGKAGADIMDSCYWARLRNVTGEFDSLIANDNATGQFFIQVGEGDFALHTGCELELVP